MRRKRLRQQFVQRPTRLPAFPRERYNDEVGRELLHDLPANTARRGRLLGLGGNYHSLEASVPSGDRRRHGNALGADPRRKRSVLDVAAFRDAPVRREQSRADPEIRVGGIRTLHRGERTLPQERDRCVVDGTFCSQ